jgi:Ca2+-binding RTX toxin-like protein
MKTTARTTALVLAAAALAAALPSAAGAATASRAGATIYFTAAQGEQNDLRVSQGVLLGQRVFTFTDVGAGITTAGSFCELVNGVAMCSAGGVTSMRVNTRDKDDTVKVATASSLGPVLIGGTIIGGRGADVLTGGNGAEKLKGNNGRDALRGRRGSDTYKAGRGSDTIQALDGKADEAISCGDGRRDLVRSDSVDPRGKSCELGNRRKRSKRR